MPRSSKHKSHKQSKHSYKEGKEYSESDEDVKMKERSSKEESLARVSRDSGNLTSGEKRKLRDGKDPTSEDYASSKRRREKAEASGGGGGDRRNDGVDDRGVGRNVGKQMKGESVKIDQDKGSRLKEMKSLSDSKSRQQSCDDKKKDNIASLVEKEESRSGRVESKRKFEKDSARKESKDLKEVREKEQGVDREKKSQEDCKGDADGNIVKRQGSQSGELGDEKQGKRGREKAEGSTPNDVHNPELKKETERISRKKKEGSGDQDNGDDFNESDDRRLSSRCDRSKYERQRDEKHKDESYEDNHPKDGDKDDRHKDDRYSEDVDKDRRRKDDKYREACDRDGRRKDDKYWENVDRDKRHMDDKYRDHGVRDNKDKHNKYQEDGERESRRRDDKYREDNRHRNDKHRGDGDGRCNENRYHEDGERDDRQRDSKYREYNERDSRSKEEKHHEDFESDGRRRDGKQADENDREKRLRDAKYRDERVQRDHSGDRSDVKRLRSESYAADLQYRKSSMHEGSPVYDDGARYKGDLGRRRISDKEDDGNNRSRNTKELRSDVEKRLASNARVSFVTERGRSTSRNADLEPTPNNSRQQISPTSRSHATRDYYRSKQEESKYRDYPFEERVRHGVSSRDHVGSAGALEKISSPRSTERLIQREDSFRGESSTERRLKSDVHNSPLVPSSASNERRHFSRSEVWRSIDGEEFAQRSGTPRDVKESRGSRELAGETLAGDELSFPDGNKVSVSSPFSRGSHFSGRPKSVLHPPPLLRSGGDSPSIFGSSEDDSRGKSINHQSRVNDHNIGRMQGNAWTGVPNWPSPAANGFMPFQHGLPPVGFHPMMQQFPMPPMFGVRPSMDLSHPGAPYHIPDAGHFSGDGRSMGWRTPINDSCGPPMHGWTANSAIFGEEAHLYGRPDWEQTRTLSNSGRNWETSGDMWKGPFRGTSVELPSGSQKEDYFQGERDDSFPGQLAQQAQNEQHKTASDAESNDIIQSSGDTGKNTPENMKINPQEQPVVVKSSKKDDTCLCHVYLSKLDISTELTEPELFDQCKSLMGVDKKMPSGVDSKILLLEGFVDFVTRSSKLSSSPLVAAMTDSVFQKAMSLYQKGREDIKVMNGGKGSFPGKQGESFPALKLENFSSESGEIKEAVVAGDVVAKDGDRGVDVLISSKEAVSFLKSTSHKLAEPPVVEMKEKSDLISSVAKIVGMEGDTVLGVVQEHIVDKKPSSTEEVAVSDAPSPEMSGDLIGSNSCPVGVEVEDKLFDAKYGSLLIPDVSSEAVMPESIESSRIHHSLESTH